MVSASVFVISSITPTLTATITTTSAAATIIPTAST